MERIDDLHRDGLKIFQDPALFCFGVDAVLLTGFVKAKPGEKLLDLCTGNGVIPILLSAKTEAELLVGLEINAESAALARKSIALNKLEGKVRIDEGDIKNISAYYKLSEFDVVTANPPYIAENSGLLNERAAVSAARHELLCNLEDVIKAAAHVLKTGGRFYMIHRPHRLTDILSLLRQYKVEPKFLRFIQPTAKQEPTMIIVEAVKGGKPALKIPAPIVIYNDDRSYTEEVRRIYYE